MKRARQTETIHTIPDGVWESSRPKQSADKKRKKNEITTDLQGNGYPSNKKS